MKKLLIQIVCFIIFLIFMLFCCIKDTIQTNIKTNLFNKIRIQNKTSLITEKLASIKLNDNKKILFSSLGDDNIKRSLKQSVDVNTRGLFLSQNEKYELIRIIYLEKGRSYPKCTYLSIKYTADVLLNRLQQWGYSNVHQVIWAPGQYSTANNYSNININSEGWMISQIALYDALENPDYVPVYQARKLHGRLYYIDPTTGEKFGY